VLARRSEVVRLKIFVWVLLVVSIGGIIGGAYTGYVFYKRFEKLKSDVYKLEEEVSLKGDTSFNLEVKNSYQVKMDYEVKIGEFEITGYSPSAGGINCAGDCNTTAIGFKVSSVEGFERLTYCAVDPKEVPLGSILVIQGLETPCVAVDTGGAIKGKKIDYLFDNEKDALRFGRRKRVVVILQPRDK
jgi:3D (Asp-Asp-Asp) domain-containing protein